MKLTQEKARPFLGVTEVKPPSWDDARIVVLPIPYERTTSYAHGTKRGPRAILEASAQVEFFDDELMIEPYRCGLYTAHELSFKGMKDVSALKLIEDAASETIQADKFLLSLGGEHTITFGLVRAVLKRHPNIHIVHLDAHADLRSSYDGTPWSHACVMRRIHELGLKITSIGIRELSSEEYQIIKMNEKNCFFAHKIMNYDNWVEEALETIYEPAYLSLDVDVFDSSLIPNTGTPSPGGLGWYHVTTFLRRLISSKPLVGADVVELTPGKGSHASSFTVAKLIYKIIGYWWMSKRYGF